MHKRFFIIKSKSLIGDLIVHAKKTHSSAENTLQKNIKSIIYSFSNIFYIILTFFKKKNLEHLYSRFMIFILDQLDPHFFYLYYLVINISN
jgi:hypothetical protein